LQFGDVDAFEAGKWAGSRHERWSRTNQELQKLFRRLRWSRYDGAMSDIAFRHLIIGSKSLTVRQVAERYAVSTRAVRGWLSEWPIAMKVNGGGWRVSMPLRDLAVGDDPDERTALTDFLNGKPATPLVRRAFEACGVLRALEKYEVGSGALAKT
jgi:hypothetical protein